MESQICMQKDEWQQSPINVPFIINANTAAVAVAAPGYTGLN
jgi:hypothetical protein